MIEYVKLRNYNKIKLINFDSKYRNLEMINGNREEFHIITMCELMPK